MEELLKQLILEMKLNNAMLYWSLVKQYGTTSSVHNCFNNGTDPLDQRSIRKRYVEKNK
jgi:hypothetical protein